MIKNEAPRKQKQNKNQDFAWQKCVCKAARARAATMAMSVYTDRPANRASIQVPNQVTKIPRSGRDPGPETSQQPPPLLLGPGPSPELGSQIPSQVQIQVPIEPSSKALLY